MKAFFVVVLLVHICLHMHQTRAASSCTQTAEYFDNIGDIYLFGDSAFLSCSPVSDPNAVSSQTVNFLAASSTTPGSHFTYFGVTPEGTAGPISTSCNTSPASPCTLAIPFESIWLAHAFFRKPTEVGATISARMEFSKVQCANQCIGGFGAPQPCSPTTDKLCSQVCAANEYTAETTCTACPVNTVPNVAKDGCEDFG